MSKSKNKEQEDVTVLLDGDILLFQAAITNCVDVCWEACKNDDIYTNTIDLNLAQEYIEQRIDHIQSRAKANKVIIVLSSAEGNFRKDIYADYKHNRKFKKKPCGYYKLKDYLVENYHIFERPYLEGDDVLGILATANTIKGKKIIWSEDKDLKTIPCTLFKLKKNDYGVFEEIWEEISVKEADYTFFTQTLTGDVSDGYIGCRGIGAAKIPNILGTLEEFDVDTAWFNVMKAYVDGKTEEIVKELPEWEGLNTKQKKEFRESYQLDKETLIELEKFALTQARCARILRREDFDMKTKSIKLWKPKEFVYIGK